MRCGKSGGDSASGSTGSNIAHHAESDQQAPNAVSQTPRSDLTGDDWRLRHFDARRDLEFTRDRVGAPGSDVRLRAEHLIAIVNDWHRYRSALCQVGSMGATESEASRIAIAALKADGDDQEYRRFSERFKETADERRTRQYNEQYQERLARVRGTKE